MSNQTAEQKKASDAYRASNPIPANETAEQCKAREAAEKAAREQNPGQPFNTPHTPNQY